jgi:hypothetical protein
MRQLNVAHLPCKVSGFFNASLMNSSALRMRSWQRRRMPEAQFDSVGRLGHVPLSVAFRHSEVEEAKMESLLGEVEARFPWDTAAQFHRDRRDAEDRFHASFARESR